MRLSRPWPESSSKDIFVSIFEVGYIFVGNPLNHKGILFSSGLNVNFFMIPMRSDQIFLDFNLFNGTNNKNMNLTPSSGWEFAYQKMASALWAGIAQLVEHKLPKLGVAGPNPVARSIEFCCKGRPYPFLRLSAMTHEMADLL